MNILSVFTSSLKKSVKIKKVSKTLGAPTPMNVQGLVDTATEKDKALDKLYELCEEVKRSDRRLKKYNLNKKKFEKLYKNLVLAGAGQWVKGHWVAASTFAFGSTLEYLLEEYDKNNEKDAEGLTVPPYWQEVSFNLIEYFDKNKSGNVV